jgi:hypothetical protein
MITFRIRYFPRSLETRVTTEGSQEPEDWYGYVVGDDLVCNGGVNLNCTPQVGVKSGQKGGSRLEESEGRAGGGKGKAENKQKRKGRNERREKGWSYLTPTAVPSKPSRSVQTRLILFVRCGVDLSQLSDLQPMASVHRIKWRHAA